ncbi:MAG: isoprenylcysteine carboxylmethyltransferase family protein [Proteobacteria bacterium]|nr:isoprenylcysteine carboxylmethyltransferase family protein [Pseudomonadota bacterium]
MQWLEHRIPPPLVGVLVGVAMWLLAPLGSAFALDAATRYAIAAALFVIAMTFDIGGLLAFRASRTTVNPLAPARASSLVTGGIYRITRNPMYVGFALLLTAWAVVLAAWPVFIGPVVYVLYITRFQIVPEERALAQLFGESYTQYTRRVRRWL